MWLLIVSFNRPTRVEFLSAPSYILHSPNIIRWHQPLQVSLLKGIPVHHCCFYLRKRGTWRGFCGIEMHKQHTRTHTHTHTHTHIHTHSVNILHENCITKCFIDLTVAPDLVPSFIFLGGGAIL